MISMWKRSLYLAGLALLITAGVVSAQPAATMGRDYTLIKPAQSTDSGKKIEVLEFFWYGCIHCYHLEAPLKAWLKRKPADVEFRFVPAIYDPASWGPMARAFYALDALGLGGKYHDDIFTAIHKDGFKAMVTDPRVMADWFANKGVDRQKFIDAYNSFAVNARVKRSEDMTRSYDVPGTPALAIDGKYMTGPSMTLNADGSVNYDRFFQIVDQLIARARKERTGQK